MEEQYERQTSEHNTQRRETDSMANNRYSLDNQRGLPEQQVIHSQGHSTGSFINPNQPSPDQIV